MVAKPAKGVALKLPKAEAPPKAAAKPKDRGPKDRKRKRERSATDPRQPKGAGKGASAGKAEGNTGGTDDNFKALKSKGAGKGPKKERSRNARRSKEKKKREKEEKALPKMQRKRLVKKKKLKAQEDAARARKNGEAVPEPSQEPAKKKKKVKAADVLDAQCRKGHTMQKRVENPAGYAKPACCDKCGMPNLPRKVLYFYHCSFCKWDICPNCILAYRMEGKRAPKRIREMMKEAKEGGNGKFAKREKKQEDARLGLEIEKAEFTRERREIWLPTDANAVSRAPTNTEVVTDWVEGMPV